MVLFYMPEAHRLVRTDTRTYNFNEIVKWLQGVEKQRQSIVNCGAAIRVTSNYRTKEAHCR
jgi:hypothetical protein